MVTRKCRMVRRMPVAAFASFVSLFSPLTLAAPDDAHHGSYDAAVSDAQNVYFYQQGNHQYLYSPWGAVEVKVDSDARFKAVDESIPLSGSFHHLVDGLYQSGKLTYGSFSMSLGRTKSLNEAEIIAHIFDDPIWESVSANQNCQADGWIKEGDGHYKQELIDRLLALGQDSASVYANTNSLLIAHDGKLMVEKYYNGWRAEFPHMIQSISKSVTSLALGVAINDEVIVSDESKLKDLMPQYSALFDGGKEQLSLSHFLTMAAGLDWDEWKISYEDPNNVRQQEMASFDPVEFVLDRGLITQPGESFRYNGGLVTVVGEVIAQKSNKENLAAFIRESELNELCLGDAYFTRQSGGVTNAAGGGYLRPRDMLKIGQLIAQHGEWKGKQLVSREWIDKSVKDYLPTGVGGHGYGYYWWVKDAVVDDKSYSVTYGLGYGGQVIAVVDDLNLVVARTATHFTGPTPNHEMMEEFIIPAFTSVK